MQLKNDTKVATGLAILLLHAIRVVLLEHILETNTAPSANYR